MSFQFELRYAVGPLPAAAAGDAEFCLEVWERSARNDGFEPTGVPTAEVRTDRYTLVPCHDEDCPRPEDGSCGCPRQEARATFIEGPVRSRARG